MTRDERKKALGLDDSNSPTRSNIDLAKDAPKFKETTAEDLKKQMESESSGTSEPSWKKQWGVVYGSKPKYKDALNRMLNRESE